MSIDHVKEVNGIRLYDQYAFLKLKEATSILKDVRDEVVYNTKEGITTLELEQLTNILLDKNKCSPLFKGFENYPYTICTSVNEEIVHGFPTDVPLKRGDVVSIDIGLRHSNGFCADSARTVIVGRANSEDDKTLVKIAKEAFDKAVKVAMVGNTTGDIGHEIQKELIRYLNIENKWTSGNKYKIFIHFCGHGIGIDLHEPPSIPNFGSKGKGIPLLEGMCICIEPVVLYTKATVIKYLTQNIPRFKTSDGSPSSHYENQVYISKDGPTVLT
jgi:methionyl aminopeptidase